MLGENLSHRLRRALLCPSCHEADSMLRTPPPRRKPPLSFRELSPEAAARRKKQNRERMDKLKPLPSMVGVITRVGLSGFQFAEHRLGEQVVTTTTVMCGRFFDLHRYKGRIVRIFVSRMPGRAPCLASIETLSRTTLANIERSRE